MSIPFDEASLSAAMAASIAKTQTAAAKADTAWLAFRRDELAHQIAHSKNSELKDFGMREIYDIAHHLGVPAHYGTRTQILNRIREHVLAAENAS